MVRVIAWLLLLVGVALAAAGGARNGAPLTEHRATVGAAAVLGGAVNQLDAAHAAHSAALDALDVARADGDAEAITGAEDAVRAASAGIAEARAHAAALREAGSFDGSLVVAAREARSAAAASSVPPPGQRFMDWLAVGGPLFGIGTVMVGIGAFLERREQSRRAAGTSPGSSGAVDFPGTVRHVLAELDAYAEAIADLPMDGPSLDVRERMDILVDDVLTPVVEGRGQLVARHGTTTFALYFGAFSAGERNLARAWSALTDGHSVEARASLQASHLAFTQALEAWEQAEAGQASV